MPPWEKYQEQAGPWSKYADSTGADASGVSPDFRPSQDRRTLLQVPLEFLGRNLDRANPFTGAGPRGAVQSVQDEPLDQRGISPYDVGRRAFRMGRGFLQGVMDPSSVQTSKEMFGNMGVSTKDIPMVSVDGKQLGVSPAGAAGFTSEAVAPLPLGAMAKGAASVLKMPFAKGAQAVAATADVVTGGNAGADLLQGISKGVAQTAEQKAAQFSEVFNPKKLPDANQYRAIMARAGIPEEKIPAAIDYGELSAPARKQKASAQGPGGGPELERYNEVRDQLQSAYNKAVEDIGTVLDPKNAGEMVRDGVLDGVERIGDKVNLTHAQVAKQIPGLQIDVASHQALTSKFDDVISSVEEVIKDGGLNAGELSSAEELVRTVKYLKKKGGSYEDLTKAATRIGQTIFQKTRSLERVSAHDKALRDIYFALNDARIGTLKTIDPKMAEDVLQSNAYLTEALNDKGIIARAIGDKNKPGLSIFEQAIANGDDKTIGAVKRFLTPDQWQSTKASLLDYYTGKGAEGDFSFKGAMNRMGTKRAQVVLQSAFDNPAELQSAVDFLKAGKRAGDPLLPGSAGQLDFGGNPIRSILQESMKTLGNIAEETGKARAERLALPVGRADRTGFLAKPPKGIKKPVGYGLRGVRAITGAESQNED